MKIYYYYHISKTGGSSVVEFFKHIARTIPKCKFYNYNDWDRLTPTPKDIDFESILCPTHAKFDYIFIHHHHGYHGLMHYKEYLARKKQELANDGHTMKIFTTIRDVVEFNNSRLNYIRNKWGWSGNRIDFLTDDTHFNIQTKYLFFCWHGEWPKELEEGTETAKVVVDGIRKLNRECIDELSDVIDLFVNTCNLTAFIKAMSRHLRVRYDDFTRKNASRHFIKFDDRRSDLLKNNKLDCYMLGQYGNKNFESEVNKFFL